MPHQVGTLLLHITEAQDPLLRHIIIAEVHHQVLIINDLPHQAGATHSQLLHGPHHHHLALLAEVVVPEVAGAVASAEEEEGINSLFFFLDFLFLAKYSVIIFKA
jgi:hypothetical protein